MSASSSSDCECDQYNNGYRTYTPIQPLYPELGHPLIYYTQIQRKQRSQQVGKNRNNCFIKAFRWYTEEHVPLKKIKSGAKNEDIQGFAAWLDQKYDEYIRKSQITQMVSSQYLPKPTSSVRTNKQTQNVVYEASVPRKNKRKSPWRRRQRNLNKQNGDTKKSDQSIEFILNPKNLSRSASEFCQKCRCSNNAITFDTNTVKSKSESVIYIQKEMYVVPSDVNDTATDKKNCNDNKLIANEQLKGNKFAKNISCQCSNVKLDKVDASSQISRTKTSNLASITNVANERNSCIDAYCPCVESPSLIYQRVLIDAPNLPLSTARLNTVSQKSVCNIDSATVPRETSFGCSKNIGKNERSISVNGIAQTSDHSINLSDVINPEHTMFLKIICAHK